MTHSVNILQYLNSYTMLPVYRLASCVSIMYLMLVLLVFTPLHGGAQTFEKTTKAAGTTADHQSNITLMSILHTPTLSSTSPASIPAERRQPWSSISQDTATTTRLVTVPPDKGSQTRATPQAVTNEPIADMSMVGTDDVRSSVTVTQSQSSLAADRIEVLSDTDDADNGLPVEDDGSAHTLTYEAGSTESLRHHEDIAQNSAGSMPASHNEYITTHPAGSRPTESESLRHGDITLSSAGSTDPLHHEDTTLNSAGSAEASQHEDITPHSAESTESSFHKYITLISTSSVESAFNEDITLDQARSIESSHHENITANSAGSTESSHHEDLASSAESPHQGDSTMDFPNSAESSHHEGTTQGTASYTESLQHQDHAIDPAVDSTPEGSVLATLSGINLSADTVATQEALATARDPTHWRDVSTQGFTTTSLETNTVTGSDVPANETTFKEFVDLSAENISRCFQEEDYMDINALSGQLSVLAGISNRTEQELTCIVDITVPPSMVINMFVTLRTSNCSDFTLMLQSDGSPRFHKHFSCYSESSRVQNYDNSVKIELILFGSEAQVDLFISFKAVPPPQLEVVFTSATTGYVQTPDWSRNTTYPSNVDSWAQVDVPANHSVMVSFLMLDIEDHFAKTCGYDNLTVYARDRNTSSDIKELILCNDKPTPKPMLFHTSLLRFHFVSDSAVEHIGFKLLFSFHHETLIPEKNSDGKWNCSVDHWPQFQVHLNCNMVEECYAVEDEENCTEASKLCGRGLVSIGGRCYSFIVKDRQITWNEAANECQRQEAYLASLNTPDEWDDVTSFIRYFNDDPVYFGLQASGPSFPELYRESFQWSDGSAVLFAKVNNQFYSRSADCSAMMKMSGWLTHREQDFLTVTECDKNITDRFLCEKDIETTDPPDILQEVSISPVVWSGNGSHVQCPSGHMTLNLLACDSQSVCWFNQIDSPTSSCDAPMTPLPPSFTCINGVERVPYTLVCDHRPDCSDNSDENFCVFPSCRLSGNFQCTNRQCVLPEERCDRIEQCLDGSDERQCPLQFYWSVHLETPRPPAQVDFDGFGSLDIKSYNGSGNRNSSSENDITCPETHFLCPGNLSYCMPVYARCNGVYDCPGRQDEVGCDSYVCPGHYRCRASTVCVHADHVCDGNYHCPQHDDELLCDLICPLNCSCIGLAFFCHGVFPAEKYPDLRFLDAHGSRLDPAVLKSHTMLIYLNVAECELKGFYHMEFPNLRILDLSKNQLQSIGANVLSSLNKLQVLSLAGNPITSLFVTEDVSNSNYPFLRILDVSDVYLPKLNATTLMVFPRLTFLNLSGCSIEHIDGEGFQSLKYLQHLDLSACPMEQFPTDIFQDLQHLKEIWADNYKLCCPATLPADFHLMNCHAPSDEISSCDALLRSDFYRAFLSVFATLALLGNLGSFIYRVFVNRVASNLGFGAFVTHLCISDFLMGVYLAVIGIADRLYQGTYLWDDVTWKNSVACKVAGFLSLLSSEVSAFIICLITFDRFLVLRFPFSHLHFRKKSAHVACLIAWLIGIFLAGVPLLPMAAHWHFYSQNGICIPLPITRNDFAGHGYSFGVIVIVNFVLFFIIAAGQGFIYWSVRTNTLTAGDSNKKSNDLTIARRLITIAMSDFLCWFPIGLLGLLASGGIPIPGEVNVAIAIIIMPVNSAINPFLYTLNMLLERRRRARERRIQKMLMSTLNSKYAETTVDRLDDSGYTKTEALALIKTWVAEGLVSMPNLEKIVLDQQERTKSAKSIHQE